MNMSDWNERVDRNELLTLRDEKAFIIKVLRDPVFSNESKLELISTAVGVIDGADYVGGEDGVDCID